MPTTPDFDEDLLLRETFMNFRSAPLPPSAHTSADAHSTVRRRRQVSAGLVAAAIVLVLAGSATAVAILGFGRSRDVQPAPSNPVPPTTIVTPSPTADPLADTADLTTSARFLDMRGSAGSVPAESYVAVRNNGPASIDLVDLTFAAVPWAQRTGDDWNTCSTDEAAQTVTCPVPAPPVGATKEYVFNFIIGTGAGQAPPMTVTANPQGRTDPHPADNTDTASPSSQGGTDIAVTADTVSAGSQTTVAVTIDSHGYNDPTAVGLTFEYGAGVEPGESGFAGCARDQVNRTVQCLVLAPRTGTPVTYDYPFTVDPAQADPQLTVTGAVEGFVVGGVDGASNDNEVTVDLTNP